MTALCPTSGKAVGQHPGRDQCVECGRLITVRLDGTNARHTQPKRKP